MASLTLLLWPLALASAAGFDENQIKAAFLYNFADFITWPGVESESEPRRVNYCTSEEGVAGGWLQSLIERDQDNLAGRHFNQLQNLDDLSGCQLLFISDGDSREIELVIQSAQLMNILTVSDQPGFIAAGGMIELMRKDARVQVHINLDAVSAKGFKISSKLMSLASTHSADIGD